MKMIAKIKTGSNAIRPFCGEGDGIIWICKIKIVARLQGINNVVGLMALCLEGFVKLGMVRWTGKQVVEYAVEV